MFALARKLIRVHRSCIPAVTLNCICHSVQVKFTTDMTYAGWTCHSTCVQPSVTSNKSPGLAGVGICWSALRQRLTYLTLYANRRPVNFPVQPQRQGGLIASLCEYCIQGYPKTKFTGDITDACRDSLVQLI